VNNISKLAHLVGDVRMGKGNFVSPGAQIIGPIHIGDNNFFGPNSVIGMPPQDDALSFDDHVIFTSGMRSDGNLVQIGNRNVFREFSTVHQGLTSNTIIEDNCYVMAYVNIAHDSRIHSGVKIANSVQMGGYSTVLKGTYIGLGAILHQFSVIGAFSMVGMGSLVTRSSGPGILCMGSPSRPHRLNRIALQKIGIDSFEWESKYLQNPSLETIHKILYADFEEYLQATEKRRLERDQISLFRSSISLTTSLPKEGL
jgi:UDP-N-acetylglucosamine acyltransferase